MRASVKERDWWEGVFLRGASISMRGVPRKAGPVWVWGTGAWVGLGWHTLERCGWCFGAWSWCYGAPQRVGTVQGVRTQMEWWKHPVKSSPGEVWKVKWSMENAQNEQQLAERQVQWFKYLHKRVTDHNVRPEQGEEGISCRWVARNEVLKPRKHEEGIYWAGGGVGNDAAELTSMSAMLKPYTVLFSKGGYAQKVFQFSTLNYRNKRSILLLFITSMHYLWSELYCLFTSRINTLSLPLNIHIQIHT